MTIVGVIPARYSSSRFPGKPLAEILGVPMVIRVAELLSGAIGINSTYVATDDERIINVVEQHGYQAVLTSKDCLTGTDRIWDFAQKVKADIYINVQGDEPLINPNNIISVIEAKKSYPDYVINCMTKLTSQEVPEDLNIPKVLTNRHNDLVYMSRLPIPGIKDSKKSVPPIYRKQVCIYAFSFEELKKFGQQNQKSLFEDYEDIEILRFFDLKIPIKMIETNTASMAVDIPSDVQKIEMELERLKA